MTNTSDSKIIIGFLLTLIGGVIGYSIQHYYNLQAKQAELWNEAKLKAYIEFIESQGTSDAARFRLGLLGSQEVILSAGKYEKSLKLESNEEARHKTAIGLFHAMRKDLIPQRSDLSPEQSAHLEWVMTPNYMQMKLQDGSKTN
jgi:hypothetical protein